MEGDEAKSGSEEGKHGQAVGGRIRTLSFPRFGELLYRPKASVKGRGLAGWGNIFVEHAGMYCPMRPSHSACLPGV